MRETLPGIACALAFVLAGCTTPHDEGDASSPPSSFLAALHSDGPAPDRASQLGLYAFLVGQLGHADPRLRRDRDAAREPRRDPRGLGARGPRDPGRLDDAAAQRAAPGRAAPEAPGHRRVVRHDPARLRPEARRLAHPVERPGDTVLRAADRPRARATRSSSRARCRRAPCCAGASPRSSPIRSTGSARSPSTEARPGDSRSRSSPAAPRRHDLAKSSVKATMRRCRKSTRSGSMRRQTRVSHTPNGRRASETARREPGSELASDGFASATSETRNESARYSSCESTSALAIGSTMGEKGTPS